MVEHPIAGNVTQAVPFLGVSSMLSSLRGGGGLMLQEFRRDDGTTWAPEGRLGVGVSIVFVCEDAIAIYREATAEESRQARRSS